MPCLLPALLKTTNLHFHNHLVGDPFRDEVADAGQIPTNGVAHVLARLGLGLATCHTSRQRRATGNEPAALALTYPYAKFHLSPIPQPRVHSAGLLSATSIAAGASTHGSNRTMALVHRTHPENAPEPAD